MRDFFNGLVKVLAVLFSILFVVTGVLALFLFNIEQRIFKAETYQAALENENIYQELPGLVSGMIVSNINSEQTGMPRLMLNLSPADWESMIRSLLPPEDLKTMMDSFLNQFFILLDGGTETVWIPLTPLKENISGQSGVDALSQLMRSKPNCSLDDLLQIIGGNVPFCNPSEEVIQLGAPLLQEQLTAVAKIIPDQVIVIQASDIGSIYLASNLRVARLVMRMSLMIPMAFLFLVTWCVIRTPKGWMQWWGIPLFFAGAFALAISLVTPPIVDLLWANFVGPRIPPFLSGELVTAAHDVAIAVTQEFLKWVTVEAGIITILGLGAWISSYFINNIRLKMPS